MKLVILKIFHGRMGQDHLNKLNENLIFLQKIYRQLP